MYRSHLYIIEAYWKDDGKKQTYPFSIYRLCSTYDSFIQGRVVEVHMNILGVWVRLIKALEDLNRGNTVVV